MCVFGSMKAAKLKESWSQGVKALHPERPGEAIDGGVGSVAVETSGLRGHGEKLRLFTLTVQERALVKVQWRPSILKMAGPWGDHEGQ